MSNGATPLRRRVSAWRLRFILPLLFCSGLAQATAPHFTGLNVLTPLLGSTVNLRSQGALTGSAPMQIQSVSILPIGLGVRATVVGGVCVEITNTLGIDLLSAGALLSVVVSNPDAPRGVRGTIAVLPGLSNNNDLSTCVDPRRAPVADAGGNLTVPDSDATAGETVTLDGSASADPDGTIVSYTWTDVATNQTLGTGPVIQPRLADGNHQIRLTVIDNSGGPEGTASTTISVAVQAPPTGGANGSTPPTPNAGANLSLLDTDGLLGELVTLDASASIDVGGTIVSYEWLDSQQNLLGVGVTLSVRLPDGVNDITLRVTGSDLLTSTATLVVTVAAPLIGNLLESIPDLTPSQRAVATAVDELCARLDALAATQTLQTEQIDLLNRCSGIIGTTNMADQVNALDELGARDLIAIRTQALLFSSAQSSGVMDRLTAMRSGARGVNFNLGGLTFNMDGKPISLQQLAPLVQMFWNAVGENGDDEDRAREPLLSDKLGIWVRGTRDLGKKGFSAASDGFRGKQWGITGGVDYRLGRQSVLGLAFGYGQSDIDFQPVTRGGLDSTSWTGSLYGSTYPLGDLYIDAVLNYANADYDTARHIAYSEGGTPIDRTAFGTTGGTTLSGGISVGYDWNIHGVTLSPMVGYFHSRAEIDSFAESGASGLDLAYDSQSYSSSTANLGLTINYAWSTPWLVLSPHLRGEYLHELNNDVEVFGVRFAHDPFADAANPTAPIVVRSDVPDQWYWRLAAGLSAQFKYGISGYLEYQRLEDFQFVSFENITVGLRFQRSL